MLPLTPMSSKQSIPMRFLKENCAYFLSYASHLLNLIVRTMEREKTNCEATRHVIFSIPCHYICLSANVFFTL
jgi:hypothetical protein